MTDQEPTSSGVSLPEAVANISEENWEDEHERPRGMLTDTDRRFLSGIKEYSHENTAINRRKDIRERMVNGILDLSYLSSIQDRDRERVFDELDAEPGLPDRTLVNYISFLIEGSGDDFQRLEKVIERAVYLAAGQQESDERWEKPYAVDVSIDIEYTPNITEIVERLENYGLRELTPEEIGILVLQDKLDQEDIEEYQDSSPTFPENPEV